MLRNFIRVGSIIFALGATSIGFCDNQTPTTSPIFPSRHLPFQVVIEQEDFSLPNGLHSYACANYEGKWLLLAGRTNGMHTFNNNNNNFPPQKQNTVVYVVDPKKKKVWSKSLSDPTSDLTQKQIDTLSVTSPQNYQWKRTLFMSGGYGVDTHSGLFSTKCCFSTIDIPGLIHWVIDPYHKETAAQHILQHFDSFFQVTGGYMARVNDDLSLLIFGQNFQGYYLPESNGTYTQQVRKFYVNNDNQKIKVKDKEYGPTDPNYRRRDLNIVPVIDSNSSNSDRTAFVALSGVFTLSGGIWNVPVLISSEGVASMADPSSPNTFKQGMNNYASATVGLYSEKYSDMYTVLFGGISYGYFEDGDFMTDPEFPFINQVTTVKIDGKGQFKQYLMNGQFPVILSTCSNPGNPLLFGAGADFFLSDKVHTYENGVIKLDKIGDEPVVLGYIVGGIQSTLPNTNVASDSSASAYIFKVTLVPR